MTDDDQFSPEEAARRRDAVIRRMTMTPPQPKKTKNKSAAVPGKSPKARAPKRAPKV